MRLKTFRAFTLAEALDAVHGDLGRDAAILHTRTFRRGGFLGIGGREIVEVIASEQQPETTILPAVASSTGAAESSTSPSMTSPKVERSAMSARARAAYASTGMAADAPAATSSVVDADPDPPVTSGSLEVDRARTRKLAQAMAIRLERQQAAREAAGVAGPDDVIGHGATADGPTSDGAIEVPDLGPVSADVESFIIGPGGVLMPAGESPETEAREVVPSVPPATVAAPVPDESPRVIALAPARMITDPSTGVPVASSIELTPPPTSSIPPAGEVDRAESELDAIRRTVGRVLTGGASLEHESTRSSDPGRDPLADAYASLVAQELSRDLADRVVAALETSLDMASRRDPSRVRDAMLREIADLVPTAESLETSRPRDGRPRTIAFVGPTGVGKTTTLAKIAATLVLRDKLSVALVTADTYRISAVDQLRTYAEILGARLEVAADPAAMREAVARCADADAVLVDTPGRSQNDVDRLAELRSIVDAARPHETHLVLSSTASERVLLREAEAFSSLGPDRIVLTKLDEAVAFGMLVSVVRRIGRRISWVTTGQEVPRDIERATGSRMADLVLGGAVKA